MKPLSLTGAINSLDPDQDDHWTKDGKPSMAIIHEMTGSDDITRADVDEAMPEGFNRENAPALLNVEPDALGKDASDALEKLSGAALAVGSLVNAAFEDGEFNAVTLMEAVVAAAQSDRFRRNSALQSLVRGYQVSQVEIETHQNRLDARRSDRAEKNRLAQDETAKSNGE